MKREFGFELLERQLIERVSALISNRVWAFEYYEDENETPIERLFMCALYCNLWLCEQEWFDGLYRVRTVEHFEAIKNDPELDRRKLFVIWQAQLSGWRVDFLINVFADWAREPNGGAPGWNSLIVECDGHDFHERTKEQAAKDRARDREAQLSGIEVFRFTGSELWRDPLGCAEQVISWANRRV
jgi:hypothetical protein